MTTTSDILPREAALRLTNYKHAVEQAVPGVEKLILFGSHARGDANADSDYDVAVIVRDFADHRRFRRVLSDLAYDHVLAGFFIRPILLRSAKLRPQDARPSELAEDILHEGVEVA